MSVDVAQDLQQTRLAADVRLIREVQDLLAHHAVIVGCPKIMGWRREAVRLPVKNHQALTLFLSATRQADLQS